MTQTRGAPPSAGHSGGYGRTGQRLLYDRPGIRVTSSWLAVGTNRFPIRELTQLTTARARRHPLTVRWVVISGALLGIIGGVLGFSGGLYGLPAEAYLPLGAAALVPVLLGALGHRLRPPAYELWGNFRGRPVLLFSSDEQREFGQVTRAVLRASEAAARSGDRGGRRL